MSGFDRFIAIDWSGAKGRRHRGIAVAVAERGRKAPVLVPGPEGIWSRSAVRDWLLEGVSKAGRALVGFDFSFAPPFVARRAYLPGEILPETGPAFWAYVDQLCKDEDLGAASLLEQHHRSHFYFGAADGRKADYMHFRICEQVFNQAGGGKPSTVFDAIGASQVAKASFAGMRVLHHLRPAMAIWPFDPVDEARDVVVEIYARAFIRLAGLRGTKIRDRPTLDRALLALGSDVCATDGALNDHETDVLVTAAGLRHIVDHPRFWSPAALNAEVAATEGWTFGIV